MDLKEVLTDIRPLFQHQINYQGIQYLQEIPANLPKILADKRYLEEILFNLILNACQALKSVSQPTIKLSAATLEHHRLKTKDNRLGSRASGLGPAIVVTIADNGYGISSDQLKNIFKPFHTTKSEGTGLGLYITKQLIEKCNGKIEISSVPKKSTNFKIYFRINARIS